MTKPLPRFAGFTLIELLAVIAIIGVLATVTITGISSASKSARDARRKSDLASYKQALVLYYSANGTFPAASSGSVNTNDAKTFLSGKLRTYMKSFPNDPLAGRKYHYRTDSNDFVLYAVLEDNNAKTDPGVNCATATADGGSFRMPNGVGQITGTPAGRCFVLVND